MKRWLLALVLVGWSAPVRAQAVLVHASGRTFLVEDARVIGARPGTFVATSRGLVELLVESPDVPLDGCPADEDVDQDLVGPAARDNGQGARLVAIAEDGSRTVLFEDAPERGARDFDASIDALRVVGTYVLATALESSNECMGLHPDSFDHSFVGFDLETGRALDLAHDPRIVRWTASQRSHARAAFARIEDELQDASAAPELVAFVPVFDRLGRVGLDAIYTMDSCYACSDADPESIGEWARYVSAAHVPSRMPAFLREAATPTSTARAAVAATGARVTGAGVIEASIAARVRSQFTAITAAPT